MHVVHEEDAIAEAREKFFHVATAELRVLRAGGAFESVEHAGFVALGLQAAEPPGADVRERLVVEVHRILRGQQDAESEGAGLLEQDHHGLLARWIRGGR